MRARAKEFVEGFSMAVALTLVGVLVGMLL